MYSTIITLKLEDSSGKGMDYRGKTSHWSEFWLFQESCEVKVFDRSCGKIKVKVSMAMEYLWNLSYIPRQDGKIGQKNSKVV